jgi:hypothetical protein
MYFSNFCALIFLFGIWFFLPILVFKLLFDFVKLRDDWRDNDEEEEAQKYFFKWKF